MDAVSVLLRAAGDRAAALGQVPDLKVCLDDLYETGRSTYPELNLDINGFAAALGLRLPKDDPGSGLTGLHAADFFLACACAQGDGTALALLDHNFFSHTALGLERQNLSATQSDELKQQLRVRVLVAEGKNPPRIASYTGRGSLRGWLRMSAARMMIDNTRSADPLSAPVQEIDRLESALANPEHALMQADCREAFTQALVATLAELSPREASFLKLHFLDGIGVAAIGAMDGVTERTARRWLSDTRDKVLRETHRRLAQNTSLLLAGVPDLLALIESQLNISLRHELSKNRDIKSSRP